MRTFNKTDPFVQQFTGEQMRWYKNAEKATLTQLNKHADEIFNLYIRERDRGLPCISCGAAWVENHQAGHFIPAHINITRWNSNNVASQCPRCNGFMLGAQYAFGVNMDKRSGLNMSNMMFELSKQPYQNSIDKQLAFIYKIYDNLFEMGVPFKRKYFHYLGKRRIDVNK